MLKFKKSILFNCSTLNIISSLSFIDYLYDQRNNEYNIGNKLKKKANYPKQLISAGDTPGDAFTSIRRISKCTTDCTQAGPCIENRSTCKYKIYFFNRIHIISFNRVQKSYLLFKQKIL